MDWYIARLSPGEKDCCEPIWLTLRQGLVFIKVEAAGPEPANFSHYSSHFPAFIN